MKPALATFGDHIGANVELADLDTLQLDSLIKDLIFTSPEEIAGAIRLRTVLIIHVNGNADGHNLTVPSKVNWKRFT